jgi:ribosomal protein S18 acetylase RimI-like enzyme
MSINIRTTVKPGDVGAITWLHGVLYAEEYDLDETFEGYVAKPLSDLVLSGDYTDQRLWLVDYDDEVKGSIAIVKNSPDEAQLRWFIIHPSLRGRGLGKQLVSEALSFCREHGYKRVILWTFDELDAAIGIYKKNGFVKTEEITHYHWGKTVTEEKYELTL